MRISYYTLISIFCCYTSFAQQKTGWYKTFTGKIGNMKAVVHLTAGSGYNGYIWFMQNQYPIQLSGQSTTNDNVQLSGMEGAINITLLGTLKSGIFKGNAVIFAFNSDSTSRKSAFVLNVDTSYTPFKYIYVKTNAHLPRRVHNASTFDYYTGTVWPATKDALAEYLENAVRDFADIPKDRDPSLWLFSKAEKERVDWQRENSKLSPQDAQTLGLSLSVGFQELINVMYENGHHITLSKFIYSYSGGAHGNYSTQLINIDKATGRKINLGDIITPEGLKQLPNLIEEVARIQYKAPIGSLEDNGFLVNKIPVSEEFYITSSGIGFLYAPYEIKSFADGEINLLVPYVKLKPFLKTVCKL